MKLETVLIVGLTGVVSLGGGCAQCPAPGAQTPAAVPATMEGSVTALFETMKMKELYERIIPKALDEQMAMNPQLAPLRDVMEAFLTKYMGWDVVGPELVRLYTDAFTKDEVDAMTAFYSTPAGSKAASLTPQLMEKGGALGRQMVEAHIPELTEMIQERLKEMWPQAADLESTTDSDSDAPSISPPPEKGH